MGTIQKRYLPVIVILVAAISGYWLFSGKAANKPGTPPGNDTKAQTAKAPIDITVYYVKFNEKDAYLVREIHRVPYTEDGPKAAVNELINGNPLTQESVKVLPSNTRLLDITVAEGKATVNFSADVLNASAGSAGEALGIQSIVNTLTEFPQIKEVMFTVEGKLDSRAMDWWGHVGLYDQPFTRSLEKVYEPAIWVTHPVENQIAGVPLLVKGSARVPEGKVHARLLDESGKAVAESSALVSQEFPNRGDFEISITFEPSGKGIGILEVFSGEGSSRNTIKIPIQWP
ncbi:MAG: GerMN domain-containing protein [Bacillota bacterium]